jgi:hypothetical protein
MRDTIDMAREADLIDDTYASDWYVYQLKRFEALVPADEREKYKWDVHSCGPTCKRYACVAMREAVQAEREACAKVADLVAREIDDTNGTATYIAAAIRARGQA